MAIYLDNHATTRLDPRVLEAMLPWLTDHYGNAGSVTHGMGREARAAVEEARETIAAAIGATAREIVFTSGATESNNLALMGVAEMYREKGNHIITSPIEHKAVLEPLEELEKRGFEVELLEPNEEGWVSAEQVRKRLREETLLVSVMHANNETGVLQPIDEIAGLLKDQLHIASLHLLQGRKITGQSAKQIALVHRCIFQWRKIRHVDL